MTWFKVDDNLAFHPKVLAAGNAAMGLWVRAGSWSAQQLTDGVIPDSILPSLGTEKQAAALTRAGLWRRAEGAWEFHEWSAAGRQPTRATVEAERAAAAERQRKHREAKGSSRSDGTVSHTVSHGNVTPLVTPTPTRPDPTRPSSSTKKKETAAAKRGSRIDPSFAITAEMREWAKDEAPLVNLDAKLPEWIDYWTGVAGEKGVKLDWVATWRNGMRKQQEFAKRDNPAAADPYAGRRVISSAKR